LIVAKISIYESKLFAKQESVTFFQWNWTWNKNFLSLFISFFFCTELTAIFVRWSYIYITFISTTKTKQLV